MIPTTATGSPEGPGPSEVEQSGVTTTVRTSFTPHRRRPAHLGAFARSGEGRTRLWTPISMGAQNLQYSRSISVGFSMSSLKNDPGLGGHPHASHPARGQRETAGGRTTWE
jgi:hypothetical protein